MDKSQVIDYGTSLIFFLVAAIVAYQNQIIGYVPQEYNLLALILFAALSQFAADKRVKNKVDKVSMGIDCYQKKIDKLQNKIDILQTRIVDKMEE